MPKVRFVVLASLVLALTAAATFAQVEPLSSDTVGYSPQTVTPAGSYSLDIDGDVKLGGFIFKDGYPFLHNDGGPTAFNTAVGLSALVSATPGAPYSGSGKRNTATGAYALQYETSGSLNTATGAYALWNATTGIGNTANGANALRFNTTGYDNTAFGAGALGSQTEGSRNVALGASTGGYNSSGWDNIWISNYGADESNTLRIGAGTGTGNFQQNRAFISGIANATGGTFSQDVCVDSTTDQLGPCSASSARFKEDIVDLQAESAAVLDLRPVRFRYKPESVGREEQQSIQYGLIAEEVAEVYPHLVTYDAEGEPMTVRYDLLTPLLLNEIKKQKAAIAAQRAELVSLRADRVRLDELAARLARLEALEATREEPALVAPR